MKFRETPVGHFLYVYAPLEYHTLTMYMEYFQHITYDLIENLALRSDNKAFSTARFRKALISFRRFGYRPARKAEWNLRDALHYAKHSFHIYKIIKESIG